MPHSNNEEGTKPDIAYTRQGESHVPDDLGSSPHHAKNSSGDQCLHVNKDVFSDLGKLRISQDFSAGAATKNSTILVQRPSKVAFIRTHPNPEFRLETLIFEDVERRVFLIGPEMSSSAATEPAVVPKLLIPAITRGSHLSIWAIRVRDKHGNLDSWNQSALRIALHEATKAWVRVIPNQLAGVYDSYPARCEMPDPIWPALSFADMLRIAFRDRVINRSEERRV